MSHRHNDEQIIKMSLGATTRSLDDHKRRGESGEQVSDVALITAQPELMPDLDEELRKLRLVAAASEQAAKPIDPEVATRSHHNSDSGAGSGSNLQLMRLPLQPRGPEQSHANGDIAYQWTASN
jgi:hypothetical protein